MARTTPPLHNGHTDPLCLDCVFIVLSGGLSRFFVIWGAKWAILASMFAVFCGPGLVKEQVQAL